MDGRRTALRYSAMTPSPAGARSRGRSIVLHDGSGRPAVSSSWRALEVRGWLAGVTVDLSHWPLKYIVHYSMCAA